jgi:hypothetical protein
MTPKFLEELRAKEGKVVQLTSTEGEVLSARVLHISEEEEDILIDILSTNQPERYERMGKSYKEGAWALPFAFIAGIESGEQSNNPVVCQNATETENNIDDLKQ